MNRELGQWLLPQPVERTEYVKIPRLKKGMLIPFGYVVEDADADWYVPVPKELDALKIAEKYCKQYTYEQVALWLTKQTGRSITGDGLRKRLRDERRRKHKYNFYVALASRYKTALEKAKGFETTLGKKDKTAFFDQEPYLSLYERHPLPERKR
jgi:hypothetical protein